MQNFMCHSQQDERKNFIDTISQLGNSAILTCVHKDGKHEAVYVSPEYISMMEDTPENAARFNDTGDFSAIIYPEDMPLVKYMLEHHEAPDKSKSIQIRKVTAKNNIIWCSAHYAFINVAGEDYVYITFSDITLFKNYEEKIRTSYDSIGQNLHSRRSTGAGLVQDGQRAGVIQRNDEGPRKTLHQLHRAQKDDGVIQRQLTS